MKLINFVNVDGKICIQGLILDAGIEGKTVSVNAHHPRQDCSDSFHYKLDLPAVELHKNGIKWVFFHV